MEKELNQEELKGVTGGMGGMAGTDLKNVCMNYTSQESCEKHGCTWSAGWRNSGKCKAK